MDGLKAVMGRKPKPSKDELGRNVFDAKYMVEPFDYRGDYEYNKLQQIN